MDKTVYLSTKVETIARCIDKRIDRKWRERLVSFLIIEVLHALRQKEPLPIESHKVGQMLRSLDDEVRAEAASMVQRYVRDLSAPVQGDKAINAEELFNSAVRPFLTNVWPQESTLTTPGVARAFAGLPAVCGESFADAVAVVERFLVPFRVWSLFEYGLYGEDFDKIDSTEKALALLTLLNLTIEESDSLFWSDGLSAVLEGIKSLAPSVLQMPAYKHLTVITRR